MSAIAKLPELSKCQARLTSFLGQRSGSGRKKKFSSQLGNFTPSKGKFNSINNNTELILRQERILLLLKVVETNNFRLQILVAFCIFFDPTHNSLFKTRDIYLKSVRA